MAANKILERIEREIGVPGLVNLLAERLTPTDLQSVMLEVYRQRAQRQQPANLLSDFESNRFVRPSTADPIRLLAWEQIAFAQLPDGFEALALSPVCPLGTNSAIALVDQNRVLSTIRNTEVVSDSTNVLTLECALVRKKLLRANPKSKEQVHRAASHRLLRTQNYNDPNSIAHFSAFALCSAGQDQGNLQFELATLATHIQFYLRALRAFLGVNLPLRVAVTDFGTVDRGTRLADQLFAPIQSTFPDVACAIDDGRESGRDYYADLCFHVYAAEQSGEWLELADGGVVNWTQTLLSNAKERCVISGIGSERVCSAFPTDKN
ncbi:MAG TPA: hypothetical protein VLK33_13160 [Terriglobales bacterium]|nr:hypothetical protein [Terriglobales bacterium]